MSALLAVSAGLVLLVTLLPILRHEAWWIRIFDFPRVQIILAGATVLSGLIMVGLPTVLHVSLAAALGGALVYHSYRILPFSALWRKQVRDATESSYEDQVSVFVANVLMENRNPERLLELIDSRDPDIILLVETDAWWTEQFERYQATHPHACFVPQDNTYGMIVLSRLRSGPIEVRRLIQDDVPSVAATFRMRSGRPLTFFGLHPRPPHPRYAYETTPRDAELLVVGREAGEVENSVIVAGDLNDVAWSHTTRLFQRISGLLDPRRGRGMFNTFHAGYWFARWPLDHIFHSRDFKLIDLERLPAFGSDHFPVFARLEYAPDHQPVDPPPQPDETDLNEIRRKIDGGRNSQDVST
jgi:endonuclease/exonuclease/phosphatase (EEP) superfamily protein YafD